MSIVLVALSGGAPKVCAQARLREEELNAVLERKVNGKCP